MRTSGFTWWSKSICLRCRQDRVLKVRLIGVSVLVSCKGLDSLGERKFWLLALEILMKTHSMEVDILPVLSSIDPSSINLSFLQYRLDNLEPWLVLSCRLEGAGSSFFSWSELCFSGLVSLFAGKHYTIIIFNRALFLLDYSVVLSQTTWWSLNFHSDLRCWNLIRKILLDSFHCRIMFTCSLNVFVSCLEKIE